MHQVSVKRNVRFLLDPWKVQQIQIVCMYYTFMYEGRERKTGWFWQNIAKQYNAKFIIRNLSVWFERAKIGYLNLVKLITCCHFPDSLIVRIKSFLNNIRFSYQRERYFFFLYYNLMNIERSVRVEQSTNNIIYRFECISTEI